MVRRKTKRRIRRGARWRRRVRRRVSLALELGGGGDDRVLSCGGREGLCFEGWDGSWCGNRQIGRG